MKKLKWKEADAIIERIAKQYGYKSLKDGHFVRRNDHKNRRYIYKNNRYTFCAYY